MPRLSITLTDEAKNIYDSWKSHERSKKVSEAIIIYEATRDIGARLEEIEKRIERLEGK